MKNVGIRFINIANTTWLASNEFYKFAAPYTPGVLCRADKLKFDTTENPNRRFRTRRYRSDIDSIRL